MAKTIYNKIKSGKIPVIKKELEDGVVAEANRDGSIYIDKDVKKGSPLEKEALAHEAVHLDQMKRGDLDYDGKNVYWKGKTYSRDEMNEGAKKLPWEKEAYDKTKNIMKKAKPITSAAKMSDADLVANNVNTHSKFSNFGKTFSDAFMGSGGDQAFQGQKNVKKPEDDENTDTDTEETNTDTTDTDVNVDSPTPMRANPITFKAKSKPSPLKDVRVEYSDIYDAELGGISGTARDKTETSKKSRPSYKVAYERAGGEAKLGNYEDWLKKAKQWNRDNPDYGTEVKKTTEFVKKTEEVPGEPGTPGKRGDYNMGYYESRNAKMGANVQMRQMKKELRKYNKASEKFARLERKGKVPINPSTGEPFKDANAYAKFISPSAEFNVPVGKRGEDTPGTEGTEGKTVDKKADGSGKNLDNTGAVVVSSFSMNKKNKSKAPFKMKGFSGFQNK